MRVTVVVALCLAFAATVGSYVRSSMFPPVLYKYYGYGTDEKSGPPTKNIFFDADAAHYADIMTDRRADRHYFSRRHPLVSLYVFPPVKAFRFAGLSSDRAIRLTIAIVCGVWTALLFFLLVVWGCRLLDAGIFTLLGGVSASAIFWFSVPESFPIGSVTIVAALLLTLWPRRLDAMVRYTAATAISLSMATTNAMVGILAAARRLPPRDIWIVGTSAWFLVCMLWGVQKLVFPASVFFFPPETAANVLVRPTITRIAQALAALCSHSMVMPQMSVIAGADFFSNAAITDRIISVQSSWPGSGSLPGLVATLAWGALAGLGGWAAFRARSGLTVVCVLALVGQILLQVSIGLETFLYTLHLLPLLIVLVAGVTFTRFRIAGLALAIVVIALGGINNWMQFRQSVAFVEEMDAYARSFSGHRP